MRLQLYPITPRLQPYIKLICSMECTDETDTRHIRVLPDTCVELFINYTPTPVAIIDHELHKRSIVSSRMNKPTEVQMRKGAGCLAICFHPGTAYRFFHLPMHFLSNNTIALEGLWKGMATEIEDKLASASNNEVRVNIIQQMLIVQLTSSEDDTLLSYCLHLIQRHHNPLTVNQLSETVGLSQRQLSRKFNQRIGISPKEFIRADRFTRSLQVLKRYPDSSLTRIAYAGRYYDQAHFIRDYKAFTGYTPGELVRSPDTLY